MSCSKCNIGLSDAQLYSLGGKSRIIYKAKEKATGDAVDKTTIETELHLEKEDNRVGIACGDISVSTWIWLIRKKPSLHFEYELEDDFTGKISFQIEFEKIGPDRIYTNVCSLDSDHSDVNIPLGNITNNEDRWRDIVKVCIVFHPETSDPYDGKLIIRNLQIIQPGA